MRQYRKIGIDVNRVVTRKHAKHAEIKIEIVKGFAHSRQRDERILCFHKDSEKELEKIALELAKHGSKYLQQNPELEDFDKAFDLVRKEIMEWS